jgi:hypothetical protein
LDRESNLKSSCYIKRSAKQLYESSSAKRPRICWLYRNRFVLLAVLRVWQSEFVPKKTIERPSCMRRYEDSIRIPCRLRTDCIVQNEILKLFLSFRLATEKDVTPIAEILTECAQWEIREIEQEVWWPIPFPEGEIRTWVKHDEAFVDEMANQIVASFRLIWSDEAFWAL